jgi:hypothetical protein
MSQVTHPRTRTAPTTPLPGQAPTDARSGTQTDTPASQAAARPHMRFKHVRE